MEAGPMVSRQAEFPGRTADLLNSSDWRVQ